MLVLLICLALGPSASPPACAGRLSARQSLPAAMFPALFSPACETIVDQMVSCADGHAYALQRRWQDAGPLRRKPVLLPTLLER